MANTIMNYLSPDTRARAGVPMQPPQYASASNSADNFQQVRWLAQPHMHRSGHHPGYYQNHRNPFAAAAQRPFAYPPYPAGGGQRSNRGQRGNRGQGGGQNRGGGSHSAR